MPNSRWWHFGKNPSPIFRHLLHARMNNISCGKHKNPWRMNKISCGIHKGPRCGMNKIACGIHNQFCSIFKSLENLQELGQSPRAWRISKGLENEPDSLWNEQNFLWNPQESLENEQNFLWKSQGVSLRNGMSLWIYS